MRERILDAIYAELDKNPEDDNLQKQVVLLGKSNICTIHSFCLDVIKNNFFETELPASFRIAAEEEILLLKQEVLDDVFEELYEAEDEKFAKLIEDYTGYRGDEPVKDIIFNIYKVIQSMPNPRKWLENAVQKFNKDNQHEEDFSGSIWGKIILENLQDDIFDSISNFKLLKNKLDKFEELAKYSMIIQSDINLLQELYDACSNSWDRAFELATTMKFARWITDGKITIELKDEVKKARESLKKKIKEILEKTLLYNSEDAYNDVFMMYENLEEIKNVIFKFDDEFKEKKRQKNIIDFSDIEHYALKILAKENEKGVYEPTDVAKKYQQNFTEIAIDEYQDSNQIQEIILNSVSTGKNIFMVGDVKQSIYKFRQACPELFLEKYGKYALEGNEQGLKIQLFKNFRSNKNILDITNTIFENIMSKELGDIDYTEEEFLNLGADYPHIEQEVGKSELHIIDIDQAEEIEEPEDDTEDNENQNVRELDKVEIEAKFVAKKIHELVTSGNKIKCKNGDYKDVEYKDIVILLRSTSSSAPIFERELIQNNIPVFSDANSEYLETMEVQTIVNLLKILDNPIQDITLVSIMRSPIGGFSDNEILEIRLNNRNTNVYENLLEFDKIQDEHLKQKVKQFLQNLEKWRVDSETLTLAELIWEIYTETGFLNYVGFMPNGDLKQANLRMLFERAKDYEKSNFNGLFNFLKFVEKMKTGSSDLSAAKVIGENENVVRIMSIHKSKGLEFPIVFLSCTHKQVNLQDLKNSILIHKDIGFGPQYIDYERKIEYPTAAKQAIKIIGKTEAISEEMRVLYVALTRAKEKLIITGCIKNFEKDKDKKCDLLNIYNSKLEKINPILLRKYTSYLDWILLVYLKGKLHDCLELYTHNKLEISSEEKKEETVKKFSEDENFQKQINYDKIHENFAWEYSDSDLINLPIKMTVSQIKQMENNTQNPIGLEEIKAKFAEEKGELTAAQKGTLTHLFLQKLNFRKNYTMQELSNELSNLVLKNIIPAEQEKYVNLAHISDFCNSEMYIRIQNSTVIEKEKTFCVNLEMPEYGMHEVSIQGIIDLYFIDENGKLVLVDYKTDFVKTENELKEKYEIQLEIYQKALELSLNKEVDEKYIYSTYLKKFIKL